MTRFFIIYTLKRFKKRFILLLALIVACGFLEIGSLGVTIQFLELISPSKDNSTLSFLGLSNSFILNSRSPLGSATAALVAVTLITSASRVLTLRLSCQISALAGNELCKDVFQNQIYQSYTSQMQVTSSDTITALTYQIDRCVQVINAFLQAFASILVGICIAGAMVAASPLTTGIVVAALGAAYYAIYNNSRRTILSSSKKIDEGKNQIVGLLQEYKGGLRDIILDSMQGEYVDRLAVTDRRIRELQSKNQYLGLVPRYTIEYIGLAVIATIGFAVSGTEKDSQILPLIGLIAVGLQRLVPCIQTIYATKVTANSCSAEMGNIKKLAAKTILPNNGDIKAYRLERNIEMNNISFYYSNLEGKCNDVISGLTLKIEKGEKIGICGKSGSGKSTVLDLIMGLLKPTHGEVLIDGRSLQTTDRGDDLRKKWMKSVAHVPQSVYLRDGSIIENISLKRRNSKEDYEKAKQCAEVACISEYIESLEDGFDSSVGEYGSRLSGGQKQRIGIARALFKRAEVLVLDEATSALDKETEGAVMSNLYRCKDITMIAIAHRLETLNGCDRIITIGARDEAMPENESALEA